MIPPQSASMERRGGSSTTRLHRGLGDVLLLLGCPGAAAWAYADALHQDPLCADTHLVRGDALARAGRWMEASSSYREAARLRPGSIEAQGSLVHALARAGRPSDCLVALEGLIRLRPFDAEPHLLRGKLLSRLGRQTPAIQAFRRAAQLKVAPDGRRFFLGEDLLGPRSWRSLLAHHRSAQALVRPTGRSESTPGHSVLNSPPERRNTAPTRSRRPRSRPGLAGLRVAVRFPAACMARAAAALLSLARATWRGFWVVVASAVARRRPHLALRVLRAAAFPLDHRTP